MSDPKLRADFVATVKQQAGDARTAQANRDSARVAQATTATRVALPPAPAVAAPFWGPRVLDRVAVEDVAAYLDRNALFRGRWGGVAHGEEFTRLRARGVRAAP